MNVMIIDTETANSVEQPLPYDIGYQIINIPTGEILCEKSFIVSEIFLDFELMKEAYFADKIPNYWKEYKSGQRVMRGIVNIRREMWNDMKIHNVTKVGAYNMGFDNRATRNNVRFISGSLIRWFFPYGTEFFDIWNMACTSMLLTPQYIKFCEENNFISEVGNYSTSAENVYRYLKNDPTFEESHTGLEDVEIEAEIFLHILENFKDYDTSIKFNCWRKVQTYAKALTFVEAA